MLVKSINIDSRTKYQNRTILQTAIFSTSHNINERSRDPEIHKRLPLGEEKNLIASTVA